MKKQMGVIINGIFVPAIDLSKLNKMEKIVMGSIGIKETADVVVAIIAFVNAGSEALEDGKITISDLPLILNPAMKLPAMFAGIGQVPAELNELDDVEKNELLVLVKEELDFSDDVEDIVIKALIIIGDIKNLIDMLNALKSKGE